MDKRIFISTILGLVALIIGIMGLYILKFHGGLLIILLCTILSIANIIRWYRAKDKK